jgi:hypothetical protein
MRVAASYEVEAQVLDADPQLGVLVIEELRRCLTHRCQTTGRVWVGDAVVQRHLDLAMDRWIYHAEVSTEESTQGEWPSIWAAIHEDGWL